MFQVRIDDRQAREFFRKSPTRARWASREALAAVGGHLRKKIITQIDTAPGWPPLSKKTIAIKQKSMVGAARYRTRPLQLFKRLARFRVGTYKGQQRVRIGFFNTKSWFKSYYGVGAGTIAKLHEEGGRSPKYGKRPRRPMVGPVWSRERGRIPGYFERKFFSNFFSKRQPRFKF